MILQRNFAARRAKISLPFHERPGSQFWAMKTTEDIRQCATEQGVSRRKAHKHNMEEKSRELVEKNAEVYAKA